MIILPVYLQMFLPANSNHLAVFTSLLGLHPTPEAGPGEVHPDVLGHVLQAIHVRLFPFQSSSLPSCFTTDFPSPVRPSYCAGMIQHIHSHSHHTMPECSKSNP